MRHFILHHRNTFGNREPLGHWIRPQALWDQYKSTQLLRKLAWAFGLFLGLSAVSLLYAMSASQEWRDDHSTLGAIALLGTLTGPFSLIFLWVWYAKTLRKDDLSKEVRLLESSLKRSRRNGWSGRKGLLTVPPNIVAETLVQLAMRQQSGSDSAKKAAGSQLGDMWDSASEFHVVDSYEELHRRATLKLASTKGVQP